MNKIIKYAPKAMRLGVHFLGTRTVILKIANPTLCKCYVDLLKKLISSSLTSLEIVVRQVNDTTIQIQGIGWKIDKVHNFIFDVLHSIILDTVHFEGSGIQSFFQEQNDAYLKEIEQKHFCYIEISKHTKLQGTNLNVKFQCYHTGNESTIRVLKNSYTDIECDVLVIPLAEDLTEINPSSNLNISKSGHLDQIQLKSNSGLPIFEIFCCTIGDLFFKKVVFVVVQSDQVISVKQRVAECLRYCEKYKSVTLPGFWGYINMTGVLAIDLIVDAILENNNKLQINVADPCNEEILELYENYLTKNKMTKELNFTTEIGCIRATVYNGDITKIRSDAIVNTTNSDYELSNQLPVDPDSITFKLYAYGEDRFNKASADLAAYVKEKFDCEVMENELLNNKDVEMEFLKESEKLFFKHNLTITNGGKKITINGERSNVKLGKQKLETFFDNCKRALQMSKFVQWKYKEDTSDIFISFPPICCLELEEKYDMDNHTPSVFEFTKNEKLKIFEAKIFQISSSKFSAKCLITKKHVDIQRLVNPENEYPAYWSQWVNQDTKPFKLNKVDQATDEFKDVLKKYKDAGLPITTVVKLERVENPTLYIQFLAQKQKVESRMLRDKINQQTTRELFHGTSEDVCLTICKNGLDRSHAGKNNTFYGFGVYFSTSAQYSHGFTDANKVGEKKMFLNEVVCGEYTLGTPTTKFIPKKDNSEDVYDSVVDNMTNPTQYVIFRDYSAYTQYLLTYK